MESVPDKASLQRALRSLQGALAAVKDIAAMEESISGRTRVRIGVESGAEISGWPCDLCLGAPELLAHASCPGHRAVRLPANLYRQPA